MKDPVDHVRRPDLPWRTSRLTECGKPINDVAKWIERDELLKREKEYGKQRTAMLTCMTCWETAARWPPFDVEPMAAVSREVYGGRADPAFTKELRALAALATKYRDEFDEFMQGLDETISLAERRRRARRKG